MFVKWTCAQNLEAAHCWELTGRLLNISNVYPDRAGAFILAATQGNQSQNPGYYIRAAWLVCRYMRGPWVQAAARRGAEAVGSLLSWSGRWLLCSWGSWLGAPGSGEPTWMVCVVCVTRSLCLLAFTCVFACHPPTSEYCQGPDVIAYSKGAWVFLVFKSWNSLCHLQYL